MLQIIQIFKNQRLLNHGQATLILKYFISLFFDLEVLILSKEKKKYLSVLLSLLIPYRSLRQRLNNTYPIVGPNRTNL